MSAPEILFLAHRIPYPPDKGDKIRSWQLLKHLCERYRVHLAAFVDDPADFAHEATLKKYCASVALVPLNPKIAKLKSTVGFMKSRALSLCYFRDQRMRNAVDTIRQLPLAAEIAFSSTMAQYIQTPVSGCPRLVDFCDADSEKFSDYARNAAVPMRWVYAREGRQLGAAEDAIANWADVSFAITPAEAERFNRRSTINRDVDWWSNGVDVDDFDPAMKMIPLASPSEIVFTGAMDYRANVEAALQFVTQIWPIVRAQSPDASFAIVGSNPVPVLRALDGKDGVSVTGRVPAIQPWLHHAKLAIAPLRIGRGVQNKVLEAMAMAKPVVATPAAATGLVVDPGTDIVVADEPDAFAEAIVTLLSSAVERSRIGQAARTRVVQDYNWSAQLARFQARLEAQL